MEKALRIEAFRNIGFKNKKPNTERQVLSHSLKKNEIGDLIILIGANNSGKTNIFRKLYTYMVILKLAQEMLPIYLWKKNAESRV